MQPDPEQIRIADNMNREYPGMSREDALNRASQILTGIANRAKGILVPDRPNPYQTAIPPKKNTPEQTPIRTNPARATVGAKDLYQQGMIEALNRSGEK